jgi:glycosyltransferase involved in cell wall biosynthesis
MNEGIMQKEALVTVLIPAYNVEDYVEKAIRSILEQSYTRLEILLINDASTDSTLKKLRSFDDPRIRVISFEKNTQKIGAVNKVLTEATGDYICFQDADDWSQASRIEKQLAAFKEEPELGICFTNYRYEDQPSKQTYQIAQTDAGLKKEFLEFGSRNDTALSPTICATMMISKQVYQSVGGYHPYFTGRVAEDIHWIYRILKNYKGVSLPQELYFITKRADSLTGLQFSGANAKAAYSWKLLEKIIYQDIVQHVDVLDESNVDRLKAIELEACEELLGDTIRQLNKVQKTYESSKSYRLGRLLLSPLRFFGKKR